MQIVIKISEEDYKLIKSYGKDSTNYRISLNLYEAVKNGTPLPKGHGELKDVDALYENTKIGHDEDGYACVTWKAINDAPTIIEAEE